VGRRYANIVSAIAVLAVVIFSSRLALAQPHGGNQPQPHGGNAPRMAPPQQHLRPDLRNRWNALPPDERQTFRKNAERWMQMSPEERKVMRDREKIYRAQVQREVDAALRDTGLRLEGEKRAQFEQRYLQERRRIEQSLHQEIDSKRQQQLPALQERLKKEFQEPSPAAGSTSAPAGSGSPKR